MIETWEGGFFFEFFYFILVRWLCHAIKHILLYFHQISKHLELSIQYNENLQKTFKKPLKNQSQTLNFIAI